MTAPRRLSSKSKIALFSILLAFALGAGAQTITVGYLDGSAFQLVASTWKPVSLGDALAPSSSVKLAVSTYLELMVGNATLSLSQAGTYSIRDLLAAGRSSRSNAIQAMLTKYIQALSTGRTTNAATYAGVRGTEQGKGDSDWATSDAEIYLSTAKDYLASGDYAAAKAQLEMARESAMGDRAEIEFYLTEAEALSGDMRAAYRDLAALAPTGTESWAPDYVLLKARMLVDSFAPQAAVDLLVGQTNLASDARRAPVYYFILAQAYAQLGSAVNEKQCLKRVIDLDAGNDLGKAATGLLKEVK